MYTHAANNVVDERCKELEDQLAESQTVLDTCIYIYIYIYVYIYTHIANNIYIYIYIHI